MLIFYNFGQGEAVGERLGAPASADVGEGLAPPASAEHKKCRMQSAECRAERSAECRMQNAELK